MKSKQRPWTCVCGRVVHGNGGKASHISACRDYKEHKRDQLTATLTAIEAGTWNAEFRPTLRNQFQHQFELELARLNEELDGVAV